MWERERKVRFNRQKNLGQGPADRSRMQIQAPVHPCLAVEARINRIEPGKRASKAKETGGKGVQPTKGEILGAVV